MNVLFIVLMTLFEVNESTPIRITCPFSSFFTWKWH